MTCAVDLRRHPSVSVDIGRYGAVGNAHAQNG